MNDYLCVQDSPPSIKFMALLDALMPAFHQKSGYEGVQGYLALKKTPTPLGPP